MHWKHDVFRKMEMQTFMIVAKQGTNCQKHKLPFPDKSEVLVIVAGAISLLSFGS